MSKIPELMADYHCSPLWNTSGKEYGDYNVDPDSLPLSPELKQELFAWAEEFDGILNMDDPASSGFASLKILEAFLEKGKKLHVQLQKELGPETEVEYRPMGDLMEDMRDLKGYLKQ